MSAEPPETSGSDGIKPIPSGPSDQGEVGEQIDPNKLSAEEQMARYEKELKETDWGHQPC